MIGGADTHDRGRTLEEIRADVVERLRARSTEIEQSIFARVSDGLPDPAGSEDAEYLQGLRVAVAAVVDYGISGIAAEGGPPAVVPATALAQARRAARVGVGLDTVLRRYVAGHALLEDFVMQELDHEDRAMQKQALREILGASVVLLDRLIASVIGAYMLETKGSGRPASARNEQRVAMPSGAGSGTQRERILEAMVELVAERGFARVSVKLLTGRAGVSSRTFYQCFESLEDCFLAVLDWGLERVAGLIEEAFARESNWRDGARTTLASLLVFYDTEPQMARIWFIEALASGSWALERRERNVALLRSMIVRHWAPPDDERPEPLAVSGVIASVLGLIHTHLVTKQPEPLVGLLGPLMGIVMTPYLDAQGIAQEVERGERLARDSDRRRLLGARPGEGARGAAGS